LEAEVDGESFPTGGVYGLLAVLGKLRRRYGGRTIMAWEGSNNYRYELFPDYKRKDKPTDDMRLFLKNMGKQETKVRQILSKLGVRQYESVGGEADDVVGTVAHVANKLGKKVAIFSADSDLQQLINDQTKCIVPRPRSKEVIMDDDAVVERWGVRPGSLALLKALAGDGSDGIPGIPGVGVKTAAKLIERYETLEDIVNGTANDDWPLTERYRELVQLHADKAKLFLRLTTVQIDMPLKPHPADRDPMAARKLMAQLKFKRLLEAGQFNDLKALAG
jgi:DNA polymerase-1